MSDEKVVNPLRVALHHIEEQLDDRVDSLNEAGPSSEESTADLIHLEETLSSAQDKAKKLVTLRLKLDEEEGTAPGQPSEPREGDAAADGRGESTPPRENPE